MNKGLENFYYIKETLKHYGCFSSDIEKAFDTIESELKRLDELEIKFNIADNLVNELDKDNQEQYEILQIIKKHKLLNYVIKNEKCATMYQLTKEEIEKLNY